MSLLRATLPALPPGLEVTAVRGRDAIAERFADYLLDESRLGGEGVECVYLPRSTLEVSAALRQCQERGWRALVSGGRTGVVGGAAACRVDAIISLARMDRVIKAHKTKLRVEAGITLSSLTEAALAAAPSRFYPVDPTETSATIGGNVATNASGAHSLHYGSTRAWVSALTVVLADGSLLRLRRGQLKAAGRSFMIQLGSMPARRFEYPAHTYPAVKNTTGPQLREQMDAIDLFVGAEGTLGAVTEVEVKLAPRPRHRLFLMVWAGGEAQALDLVARMRAARGLRPLALEYFDPRSIELLKARRAREGARSCVPSIDAAARAALFVDLAYRDDDELERISARLERVLGQAGLSVAQTWSGLEEQDLARMKQLRHALPEAVNQIVSARKRLHPGLHKLSTDLAVPRGRLGELLQLYRARLQDADIEHVIFGHIGDDHLHMNMLPRDGRELARAQEIYDELAAAAVALGGTIAAEHGVGRLKRHLMPLQYPPPMIDAMRRLKLIFDPEGRLSPGVLLPD